MTAPSSARRDDTTRPQHPAWIRLDRRGAVRDVGIVTALVAAGIFLGSMLGIDEAPERPDVDTLTIFMHNAGIALLIITLTKYCAYPVIWFNAIFLGAAIYTHTALTSVAATLALTAIHVPLEIVAWVLSLRASRHSTDVWSGLLRHAKGGPRLSCRTGPLRRLLITAGAAIGIYLIAAAAEHATLLMNTGA